MANRKYHQHSQLPAAKHGFKKAMKVVFVGHLLVGSMPLDPADFEEWRALHEQWSGQTRVIEATSGKNVGHKGPWDRIVPNCHPVCWRL